MYEEYYHSSVGYCTIFGDIVDKPELVAVSENSDYGTITVVKRSELVPKEETWEFTQAKKRADEIRLITAKVQENLDELAERVVDKALKSLASRIKFNVAFGEGGSHSAYAIMLSTELEKLIRESGKKVAGKGDIDL